MEQSLSTRTTAPKRSICACHGEIPMSTSNGRRPTCGLFWPEIFPLKTLAQIDIVWIIVGIHCGHERGTS